MVTRLREPNQFHEFPESDPAAIAFALAVFYDFKPLPVGPVRLRTLKQTVRNNEIRQRYLNGETQTALARAYKVSVSRISQIVNTPPDQE
ncbi:MAG: hypothetical protein Kow0077_15880 [Anaerolineae bacterium]